MQKAAQTDMFVQLFGTYSSPKGTAIISLHPTENDSYGS